MNVLVDTSVVSFVLRRRAQDSDGIASLMARLVSNGRALVTGVVLQESLSGLATAEQFERVRTAMALLPYVDATRSDHEDAAEFWNQCRWNGVQGSLPDFLLCAIARRLSVPILTTDGDFANFARVIPVTLYDEAKHG